MGPSGDTPLMATTDDAPWRALAAASGLGGALFAVWLPIDDLVSGVPGAAGSAGFLAYYLGWAVAALALAAGAYGLFRFRGDVAGVFGTVSLATVGLGFLGLAAGGLLAAAAVAVAPDVMFAGLLLAVLGGGALGVVTFRVAGFDRRAGLLLVLALLGLVVALALAGTVTTVVALELSAALCSVPFGLAWLLFGRSLTVRA